MGPPTGFVFFPARGAIAAEQHWGERQVSASLTRCAASLRRCCHSPPLHLLCHNTGLGALRALLELSATAAGTAAQREALIEVGTREVEAETAKKQGGAGCSARREHTKTATGMYACAHRIRPNRAAFSPWWPRASSTPGRQREGRGGWYSGHSMKKQKWGQGADAIVP